MMRGLTYLFLITVLLSISSLTLHSQQLTGAEPKLVQSTESTAGVLPVITTAKISHKQAACGRGAALKTIAFNRLPGIQSSGNAGKSSVLTTPGHTFGAFWKSGSGFASMLILRNRDLQSEVSANVVVFRNDGKEIQKTGINLAPNEVTRVPLGDLDKRKRGEIQSGSVMLEFLNGPASRAIGEIIIENESTGVIFDVPLLGGYRYDSENSLLAPWWLPDRETDGSVTLFNVSEQSIVVSPSLIVNGQEQNERAISVASHETKQISLLDLLHKHGVDGATHGALALRYTGPAHALDPELLLENPSTGFSLVTGFNSRHSLKSNQQTTWQFPSVFLEPDPQLGFNPKDHLTALVLLSNGTNSELRAQLTAHIGALPGRIKNTTLPLEPLKPLESRLVNLSLLGSRGLIPEGLSHMALEVGHEGAPGDLGITVFSVGRAKDFVLRAQGSVRVAKAVDATYWDISRNLVALLTAQNVSDVPITAQATLFYQRPGGKTFSYLLNGIDIAAHGSQVLNLKQLILSGIPDRNGSIIPPGITFGTLTLEVLDKKDQGLVWGGAESFDPVRGGYGFLGFPPSCDLCDTCEICDQPTETGGVCITDCSDPACGCFVPPPPVPADSRITSTVSNGTAVCPPNFAGWQRTVNKVTIDQYGADFPVGGQVLNEAVTISTPNDLNILQSQVTTGTAVTNSDGAFQDVFFVCSAVCPSSAGQTVAAQTTTDSWPGVGLFLLNTNTLSYKCKGITVNGQ